MPPSNRRPIEREDVELTALPDVPKAAPIPAQAETVVLPKTAPAFKQPCTLKGATSALYAGMLGYFLGVVPATIKFKARQWGMIHTQGLASAQQLAIMSGMYTAVHCICQRIRMVEDGWNRGVAGCSTGAEHAAALAFDKRWHARPQCGRTCLQQCTWQKHNRSSATGCSIDTQVQCCSSTGRCDCVLPRKPCGMLPVCMNRVQAYKCHHLGTVAMCTLLQLAKTSDKPCRF